MSSGTAQGSDQSGVGETGPHQQRLVGICITQGRAMPRYHYESDRRGGRTAWRAAVEVANQTYTAQFWYSGERINAAREDAAEKALQALGVYQARVAPPSRQQSGSYHG